MHEDDDIRVIVAHLCLLVTAVPPGPPVARVAATTDHSIDVEWDPPVDNGGGEILGYHVDKVISFTHMPFQLFFSDCLDFYSD